MEESKLENTEASELGNKVIRHDKEKGVLIIDTDQIEDFKMMNVSQGRISMESTVREKIGLDKEGEVLVTHVGENYFFGKTLNQSELDNIAMDDLK